MYKKKIGFNFKFYQFLCHGQNQQFSKNLKLHFLKEIVDIVYNNVGNCTFYYR